MFSVFTRKTISNKKILGKYDNEYFIECLIDENGKDICKIKPITKKEYEEIKKQYQ